MAPGWRGRTGGRPVLGAAALVVGALSLTPLVYLFIRAFEGGTDRVLALVLRARTLDLALRDRKSVV